MNASFFYIAFTLVVLVIVALIVFFAGGKREANRLTPLAGLAFGFVLAGLFFGENRLIGYGLFAIGVFLAVIDLINRSRVR